MFSSNGSLVSSVAPDAQFNYVTMLLHGDGTNGAQNNTFIDSSSNAFSITRNGNTTQGSFSPYGPNWSNAFDGDASGDNLIAVSANTANAMGTGDWTAEAWIFLNVGGLTPFVFDTLPTSSGSATGLRMRLNASNQLQLWQYGSAVLTSTTTVAVGTWTHVALVKSSGTTTAYINGTASNTYSDSGNYICGTNRPMIGSDGYNNGSENTLNGYISNLRLVKGTAVYTGNFTPSTTPLTAITNTSLLACQDNRFKDNSSNNFTLTANGTPTVQRFNPFGTSTAYSTSVIGGSGYFDGSGDYLDGPTNAAFAFGTGDFTLSAWVYIFNGTSAQIIWTNQTTSGASAPNLGFFILGNKVCINNTNTAHSESTGTIANNSWNYVGVTKASGTYTFYINGSASGTTGSIGTNNFTENACHIGYGNYGTNYNFGGYIADLRVIKGSAVTPSVPTAPVGTVTNTQLLLNMTNGAIFDNAMMNDLETVGNAQISTSVVKYGTGSLAFDGSGDYLTAARSPQFAYGTGNFTIEFWTYPTSFSGFKTFYSGYLVASSAAGFELGIDGSGFLYIYSNNGFAISASSSALALNAWNHVAMVRNGSTITVYIDGVSKGTWSLTSQNFTDNYLVIGQTNTGPSQFFTGYLDDLRITKGYARYTATFTPPTAALSDTGPY